MSAPAATLAKVAKPISDHTYINHPAGFACPWCASSNIAFSGTNLTFHGDSIGQATSCDDCGREWETIYTLTGYSS